MSIDEHTQSVDRAFPALEIQTSGTTTIHVRLGGNSAAVVLVQGLEAPIDMWAPLVAALSWMVPPAGGTK
jgi:hypothetical protein